MFESRRFIPDIYKDFGFEDVRIKFSDRPEARIGDDDVWTTQAALMHARNTGLPYGVNPGEGAFYGPKLNSSSAMRLGAIGNVEHYSRFHAAGTL